MLNHGQIMKAMLLRLDGDVVVEFDKNAEQARVVMTKASVNPEYFNLLRAAPILYQTIEEQSKALGVIIEAFEQAGLDGCVPPLLDLQAALALAKRIALDGIEAVAKGVPQ